MVRFCENSRATSAKDRPACRAARARYGQRLRPRENVGDLELPLPPLRGIYAPQRGFANRDSGADVALIHCLRHFPPPRRFELFLYGRALLHLLRPCGAQDEGAIDEGLQIVAHLVAAISRALGPLGQASDKPAIIPLGNQLRAHLGQRPVVERVRFAGKGEEQDTYSSPK